MEKQVRHRIASRDYRLMVGVLFLAVSVTAVVCAAVALGSIGRSTQQTNEALDAAITAYDRYLQEISSGEPWTQELSVLNEGDFLATLSRRIRQAEDAGERATLVAQLQGLVAQFERESLASGANLYVYDPSRGLLTGASYFGPYADAPDARLAQVDVGACLAEGRSISHLVTGGGDGSEDPPFSMVRFAEVLPGCVLVEFHDMPELPGLDMLSPISDMTELFFVDRYGNVCAYWGRDACAAAVSFQELETGDSAQSGILTVEHADRSYRCYYHDACAGYLKFALVAPNVAREAYEQFALGIIVAAGVLIVLGCAMGALLTRRIYAPLREIIQRLTPADQAEHDEFRLVALAIRAMERRLGEQAGAVEGYHLARLLHGQADAERESRGFFFGGAGCSDPPGGGRSVRGSGRASWLAVERGHAVCRIGRETRRGCRPRCARGLRAPPPACALGRGRRVPGRAGDCAGRGRGRGRWDVRSRAAAAARPQMSGRLSRVGLRQRRPRRAPCVADMLPRDR